MKRGRRLQQLRLLILSNHLLLNKRQNIDHSVIPIRAQHHSFSGGGNLYFRCPMKRSPKVIHIGFVSEHTLHYLLWLNHYPSLRGKLEILLLLVNTIITYYGSLDTGIIRRPTSAIGAVLVYCPNREISCLLGWPDPTRSIFPAVNVTKGTHLRVQFRNSVLSHWIG